MSRSDFDACALSDAEIIGEILESAEGALFDAALGALMDLAAPTCGGRAYPSCYPYWPARHETRALALQAARAAMAVLIAHPCMHLPSGVERVYAMPERAS